MAARVLALAFALAVVKAVADTAGEVENANGGKMAHPSSEPATTGRPKTEARLALQLEVKRAVGLLLGSAT